MTIAVSVRLSILLISERYLAVRFDEHLSPGTKVRARLGSGFTRDKRCLAPSFQLMVLTGGTFRPLHIFGSYRLRAAMTKSR